MSSAQYKQEYSLSPFEAFEGGRRGWVVVVDKSGGGGGGKK